MVNTCLQHVFTVFDTCIRVLSEHRSEHNPPLNTRSSVFRYLITGGTIRDRDRNQRTESMQQAVAPAPAARVMNAYTLAPSGRAGKSGTAMGRRLLEGSMTSPMGHSLGPSLKSDPLQIRAIGPSSNSDPLRIRTRSASNHFVTRTALVPDAGDQERSDSVSCLQESRCSIC